MENDKLLLGVVRTKKSEKEALYASDGMRGSVYTEKAKRMLENTLWTLTEKASFTAALESLIVEGIWLREWKGPNNQIKLQGKKMK